MRGGGEFNVDGADGMLGAALESAEGAGVGIEPVSGAGVGAEVESGVAVAGGGTGPMRVLVSELEAGAGAGAGVSPLGVDAVS